MKRKEKCWTKGQWFRLVVLILVAILALGLTVFLTHWIIQLRNPDTQAWFQSFIKELGVKGWFVILAIQYLQIVLAFVPGGPVQILAGLLYGPVGGLAVCLLGTILATATVYFLVSKYGQKIIYLVVGEWDTTKYKFLQNNKKLQSLVLLLFFIPGTPKDALTYLFALTPLAMNQFMVLSNLARIPAMFTSILAGRYIAQGQWGPVLILFLILGLISGLGLLLHRKILHAYAERKL